MTKFPTIRRDRNSSRLGVLMIAALLLTPAALAGQARSASDIYRDKCAVCHGEDGAGKTAKGKKLNVKDVHETVAKLTEEQIAVVVTKGKEPDMDAYGKEMTPEQIREVVAYYRDLAKKK